MGVRAFPIDRDYTIKFEGPLTIVAGINGSGKTTIIECLRFATTGALPPGAAKGGAWIHDPGLRGENKVLAQVRIQLHSANRRRIVAVRNMELSIKRSPTTGKMARQQKTLECALLDEHNGQKRTLSTRVAELDQLIPNYLGVSTSLLDNVIFCHQEDSHWPLAESSVLKKKFDEIFEAGKYTKAVQELVSIRKRKRNDIGRLEAIADAAKKDKTRATIVDERRKEYGNSIQKLKAQADSLQERIDQSQAESVQKKNEADAYTKQIARLEAYRIDLNSKEEMSKAIKKHLKEIPESDDWLQRTLQQFDQTLSQYQAEKTTKQTTLQEIDNSLKTLKNRLDHSLTEQGQLQQAKADFEQHLSRRKAQIKENATKYQLRGYEDLEDEDKVQDFLPRIKKLRRERNSKLEHARADGSREVRDADIKMNKLTERQKVLKDNRITASREIAANNQQIRQRQTEADGLQVDEGNKAEIESRIEDLQHRLQATKETLKTADYPTKIKQANLELASWEEDRKRLNNELVQGTKRAGEVAQLAHVKQEVKDKQRSLHASITAHRARLNAIIGSDWDVENLHQKYQIVFSEAVQDLSSAEHERDRVLREGEQLQFQQKTLRDELKKKKGQAKDQKATVEAALEGDIIDYHTEMQKAEDRLNDAREALETNGGLADFFKKILDTAEQKSCCRICMRAWKPGDAKLGDFKNKVKTWIDQASVVAAKEEFEDATNVHKSMIEVAASYNDWKRLTETEIPTAEKQLGKMNEDYEKSQSQLQQHDGTVESKTSRKAELDSISSTVLSIGKTQQEISALNAKIDDLTTKQSQHGETKTLDDIQEELADVDGKTQQCKQTVARLTNEQDTARSESYTLDLELQQTKGELEIMSRKLDHKMNFLSRIEEYRVAIQKQKEAIVKIDADMEKIGPDIDAAREERETLAAQAQTREEVAAREVRDLDETISDLQNTENQIKAYSEIGGEATLNKIMQDIRRSRSEISQQTESQKNLNDEITRIDKHLNDSDHTRRHYTDNLRYRELSRDTKWLREEIEALESNNAEHDRAQLVEEAEAADRVTQNSKIKREGIMAECKTKDLQLQEYQREWETDLFDAASRHTKAQIQVESTKAAVEDLGKFSTALDKAVTKYHALKMKQVNSIMDDLWKNTYMGTDVDTIYIKSDLEVKSQIRTHNYRVVMLKREVELDMRGRCSAGQKVLASIIIRLALAECFSKDCGVIALDEPTTNLDEHNIEALASSLHRIIDYRKHQSNFQLIIITHDERFLELLNAQDFCSDYYIVRRDNQDNSVIEKQSIRHITRK